MRLFLLALALIYVVGVYYARSILIGREVCAVNDDAASYAFGEPERLDPDQWRKIANQAKPVNGSDAAQTNPVLARSTASEAAAKRPCQR
jgi:hypothetical protein